MVAISDVLCLMPSGCGNDIDTTRNRVLVCAPSHAAADVITHRLMKFLDRGSIFRLYDKSRPTNTVPVTIMPCTCTNAATDDFTLPALSGKTHYITHLVNILFVFLTQLYLTLQSSFQHGRTSE
jgi:hypothetical protein